MNLMVQNMSPRPTEIAGELMHAVTFGMMDASFSMGKYLVVLAVAFCALVAAPALVVAFRGGNSHAAARCAGVAGLGALLLLTPLTALAGIALWGWAIWLAFQRGEGAGVGPGAA